VFQVPRNRIHTGFPFSGIRKPVLACYKIKDKLYPNISVSKNAQNRFVREVQGFLENVTRRNRNPDTPKLGGVIRVFIWPAYAMNDFKAN
jgi:hypothetical protein